MPTIAALTCNAKLKDITLPEGFAFAENSEEIAIGTNKRTLAFTPSDTKNYEIVNNIEITITVKDHEYAAPTCTWSSDGKTCTATVVCKNDKLRFVTETATITSKVTTEATTEAKGATTYTATFANKLFTTQTKTVEDIDKLEPEPEPEPEPQPEPTPVSSVADSPSVKVWSYVSTIFIESAPDTKYTIIDLSGRTIKSATTKSTKEEISAINSGFYIVKIGNASFKVSVR